MTTERIDIIVRDDGSRVVRRNLDDIGDSADKSAGFIEKLKRSLGGMGGVIASLGIGFGIREIIKYTDTWVNLEGRLKLVTNTTSQLIETQKALFDIAQRTRGSYADTADVYVRVSRATSEMNVTDQERLKVSEAINKSLIIAGTSQEEARRGLIQLSQGFATGTIRGQDLNSVLEQTPRLAQAIAEGMGKTVGELRKMGEAGTLTSQAVFKAIENQSEKLQKEFSQMPVTIGQAFTVLENELLKFVGTTNTANGTAKLMVDTIGLVARNISTLAAALAGLTAYKLADFFLNATVAVYNKITALQAYVASLAAERAATIASAEAAVLQATASGAQLATTEAAILIAREEMVTRLAQANANIVSAKAAIEAATAAGAQSYALRVLTLSTNELAAAEARRVVAVAELATLGQQQARVSAQIAVAQAAQATATSALATATAASSGAATLAARAMGFLGGPIGIITTLLGLGVTAWSLWGSSADKNEKLVSNTLHDQTQDIIANLDKQIEKLKERNAIAASDPGLAKSDTAVDTQKRALITQMNLVASGGKGFEGLGPEAKQSLLSTLGAQYNELSVKAGKLADEQEKFNKGLKNDKLKEFFNLYSTTAEAKSAEIKKWKDALGDLFSPEVEKRLNEHFDDSKGNQDFKSGIQALEMKQKLEREILKGRLQDAEAMHSQELMSDSTFIKVKEGFELSEIDMLEKFTKKQLALAVGAGDEQLALRARYNGELAVLEQQRKNIMQNAANQTNALNESGVNKDRDLESAQLAALYDQNQAVQDKIKFFQKLPAAITAARVAELEESKAVLVGFGADKAKIDAVQQRIDALKRLGTQQELSAQQDLKFADTKNLIQEWKELGDTIATSMGTAFGEVGKSIGGVVTALTDYQSKQEAIAQDSKERMKSLAGNADLLSKEEQRAARESEIARVESYANVLGAAKSFFGEHTAGYKVLATAEKAYRVYEIALALENFAIKTGLLAGWLGIDTAVKATAATTDTAFTGASVINSGIRAAADGVAAFAKTLASLPFPFNIAAGAAVIAALAAAGVAIRGGHGGGGTSAADVQKLQGTGTVFGDPTAKSNSISKSIDALKENSSEMLPLTQGMLNSLLNIEASMTGLTNLVLRTTGITDGSNLGIQTGRQDPSGFLGSITSIVSKIPIIGGVLGSLLGGLFGKSSSEIIDSGLQFGGRVSDLQGGQGVQQYASVNTTSSSWFGLSKSTSNSVQVQGVSQELASQFGLIFTNLQKTLVSAAGALGKDGAAVAKSVEDFVLPLDKISLKGLTGQALQDALNAVISKAMDNIAQAAFPEFDEFRKVGEGYAQTVVRVASGIEQAKVALNALGIESGNYKDIVNKQGDVATEIIRAGISDAEKLNAGVKSVVDNFSGSADDLIAVYKTLVDVRQHLQDAGLNGSNLSVATIQGAGGVKELKEGADNYFKYFFTEAEQKAAQVKQIADQFARLGLEFPETNEAFKTLVQRFDDGTEAGNRMVGQLLALSGAYAEATDHSKLDKDTRSLLIQIMELENNTVGALAARRGDELAAADASLRPLMERVYALQDEASELQKQDARRSVSIRIMELEGDKMGALNARRFDEYRTADASVRPLLQRVYALEDEAAATELAKSKRQIEIQIMELSDNKIGALAAQRQIELAAADESLRPLMQRVYGLQDEATAVENLKKITEERNGIELQILQMNKDSTVALAFQRQVEMDKTDAANRPLLQRLYALQDEAAATQKATDLAKAASTIQSRILRASGNEIGAVALERQAELDVLDASLRPMQQHAYALEDLAKAHDVVQTSYDKEKESLTTLRDKYVELGKSLRGTLDGLLLGDSSPLSPTDKYEEAKRQFEQNYSLAKSGDPVALEKMQSVSEQFLSASKGYNASSEAYASDFARVKQALEASINAADAQVSIAQQSLNKLDQMVQGILEVNKAELSTADAIKAYMVQQDKLNALPPVAPVPIAPPVVAGPVEDKAPKLTGNAAIVEGLYTSLLGRPSDAEGFAFWKDVLDSGRGTLAGVVNGFLTSDEYSKLHPLARAIGGFTPPGMTWVGERGPELVNFSQPSMVYTADQSYAMTHGNEASNENVEALLTQVLEELQNGTVQRGAVATATIEKLDAVSNSLENVSREIAKERS